MMLMRLRNSTYLPILSLTVGLLLSLGAIRAQEPPPPPPPPASAAIQMETGDAGFFLGERVELLGFEGAGEHQVVKGAPFSAEAVSETTQTLADGNRIRRSTQTNLYRDSEGRTRREVTLLAIGPLAASGRTHTFTSIHDPVAGVNYVLEPEEKIARKLPSMGAPAFTHLKDQLIAPGASTQASAELKTESLGAQTINGVSAEGTRYTRTIPTGHIGNERPLVVVSERWYAPDLQTVVMSKRSDPRFGETTYQLTNIQRTEPDPSLFQVPPDYTVQEGGPGKHARVFERRAPAPPAPPDL